MSKKYLLAVSGGPDSMFLLDMYKSKNIVAAHVNYHRREDSNHDENIVRAFCAQHGIKLETLDVKVQPRGNFQAWARQVRYDFFANVYKKHECDALLTAHHKDDFLETAWMQMQSGREPKYFGIVAKNVLQGMNIKRPLVDMYWKDQILKALAKKKIAYAIDTTNALPLYERNKVRQELTALSPGEKQNRYEWFVMSNKILKKKQKRVKAYYVHWSKTGFALTFFRQMKKYRHEVIFLLIHESFVGNDVSTPKIEGLIQFIDGPEGEKKYYVSATEWFKKTQGFLLKGHD